MINMQKPKKNDELTLTITAVTIEGAGVARLDSGFVIFVQDAAVGDVVRAHIMKVQKNFAYAKITEIITPSKDRTSPDCAHYKTCGGCALRHISYEAELQVKRETVLGNIKKFGHVDLGAIDIAGAEHTLMYRNKAQFPIKRARDGRLLIGFYRKRSHDVVNLSQCAIQSPRTFSAIEAVREYIERSGESVYDETAHKGALRSIFVREGRKTGDVLVAVVANADALSDEPLLCEILRARMGGLCGVILNTNQERTNVIMGEKSRVLWGRDEICDEILGLKFYVPHRSFYQVNPEQTQVLYKKAIDILAPKPHETLLDLYCGAGTITACLATRAKRVIGVEVVPDAVKVAKKNAAANNLSNCEFYCGDAGEVADKLQKSGLRIDALVVDPPRKGLDENAVAAIAKFSPERIMYVSCDSATLGRDIARLRGHGYNVAHAEAVDMFPRCEHVETVCLMSRVEGK